LRVKRRKAKSFVAYNSTFASIYPGRFGVATYKIVEKANEFRIEIVGRFAGDGIQDVRQSWEQALRESVPRTLSVDISRLSGYDLQGRKLLAEMYRHGTQFAARTPSSLVFLNEIANTPRNSGTLIEAPVRKPQQEVTEPPLRALAAGR
jgi:hypothetical protein